MSLPDGLRVVLLLQERCPRLVWDPALVVQCVADFEDLDVLDVAARCALYCQQKTDVRNGPRTLRVFMEDAREKASLERLKKSREEALAPYHRPRNTDDH